MTRSWRGARQLHRFENQRERDGVSIQYPRGQAAAPKSLGCAAFARALRASPRHRAGAEKSRLGKGGQAGANKPRSFFSPSGKGRGFRYWSAAYAALAWLKIGMFGSASFHNVRKA